MVGIREGTSYRLREVLVCLVYQQLEQQSAIIINWLMRDALDQFAGEWLDAGDAGLPVMSRPEIAEAFAELDLRDTLLLLGYLNLVLQRGGTFDTSTQCYLAGFLLPNEAAENLFRVANGRGRRVAFFHPHNVRGAIKLAWTCCAEADGRRLAEAGGRHIVGNALLSLSAEVPWTDDQVYGRNDPKRFLGTALMAQHAAYMPLKEHQRIAAVKDAILSHVFEDATVLGAFRQHNGMEPWQVVAANLILTSYFNKVSTKCFQTGQAVPALDPREAFGIAGMPRGVGDRFLQDTVALVSDRPSAKAAREGMVSTSDYAFLVAKPFVDLGRNQVVCLDLEYAQSLLAYDLFRRTARALKAAGGRSINDLQGRPFENFCRTVLKCAAGKRRDARFVGFDNDPQELDGAYQEGGTVAIMEFKAGVIDIELSYGADVAALASEIDKRYIVGTNKGPKGFSQLVPRVERLLQDPRSYNLRRQVHTVIPVVVVEERFMQSCFAQMYCEERAAPMFERFGSRVARPMVLQADDLVRVGMRAKHIGFADCLLRCQTEKMRGALTMEQWLSTSFPPEGGHVGELGVEFAFLEKAALEIRTHFKPVSVPECSCGHAKSLVPREPENPMWRCEACEAVDVLATDEELQAYHESKATAVSRYLSS